MPVRIHGGVFSDQMLTGSLAHYLLSGADFSGAINSFGQPVAHSAAEIIFNKIEAGAYIDIMNPNKDNISFALEADRSVWDDTTLTNMVQSLGTDVGVDHINCSVCTVEQVPYIWGTSGATSFLSLDDTPDSYIGAANWTVVVNPSETGLIFVPPAAGSTDYLPATPGDTLTSGFKYFVLSAGNVYLPIGAGILPAGSSVTIAKPATNPQAVVFVYISSVLDTISTQLGDTNAIEMDAPASAVFVFDGIDAWHLQIGSVN